ncbi:MAG: glutamate--tRNA ligase [Candidatus Liptonbacteria bacterium]|nr:glutamate--tRNA ligase [Candidatus Liptonbacteria bacterium]
MTPAEKIPVRVRFAPSPTGFLHIGSVRTALFNWIFARQHGGKFILRIEDTDTERSKKEYENDILSNFKWLGLDWDEGPRSADERGLDADKRGNKPDLEYKGNYGPYRQSERKEYYKKYLKLLLEQRKSYYCFCSKDQLEADRQQMLVEGMPPKYTGRCRSLSLEESGKRRSGGESSVIRFYIPETEVEFDDLVRGKVRFDASLAGDIIIAKSLDEPLYNFAATVDDELMEITHIIRGEEHLSNTPKQILIQQALNFRALKYGHIPLILNPDRTKMSKRYLESSISDYRANGYLPEAILNFLVLLGWHPKDNKEIFDLEEMAKEFEIKRVQKAGAIFNIEKLNWLNAQRIRKMNNYETAALLEPFLKEKNISAPREFVEKIIEVERERVKTIKDFIDLSDFFFKLPDYEAKMLVWKNGTHDGTKKALSESETALSEIPKENFEKETIAVALQKLVEKLGRGEVYWPLRVAVSGKQASPDPLVIMDILGKEETERRLKVALDKINPSR